MELNFSWLSRSSFERTTQTAVRSTQTLCCATSRRLFCRSEIKGALNQAFPRIQETLEKWTQRGSGWVVDQVLTLWLDIARYQPLRGGSYIPLPPAVRLKKAVVNVKNKDDHCLRWALRTALFPARDHVDRPSKYPTDDGLSFEGIDAPTPISQILIIERQNNLTWPSASLGGIRE